MSGGGRYIANNDSSFNSGTVAWLASDGEPSAITWPRTKLACVLVVLLLLLLFLSWIPKFRFVIFSGRIVLCLTSNPSRNACDVFSVAFLSVTSTHTSLSKLRFKKRPPFSWMIDTILRAITAFSFFLAPKYSRWWSATIDRNLLLPIWLLVAPPRPKSSNESANNKEC